MIQEVRCRTLNQRQREKLPLMKKRSFVYALVLGTLAGCKPDTRPVAEPLVDPEIRGVYVISGFNLQAELSLSNSNTFQQTIVVSDCFGGHESELIDGEYIQHGNQIILKPIYLTKSADGLFNKQDEHRTPFKTSKRNFRDTLTIVKWNNTIYLLSAKNVSLWGYPDQNDFIKFINDVNSGFLYTHPGNNFWTKPGNDASPEAAKALPEPWSKLLIQQPIEATITTIKPYPAKDDLGLIKSIVTIDKGSRDGVWTGMQFYATTNTSCSCDFTVTSITEKTATGHANICGPHECTSGVKLSTHIRQ